MDSRRTGDGGALKPRLPAIPRRSVPVVPRAASHRRASTPPRATVLALATVLGFAGCAPMAEYTGPRPAAGVTGTTSRNALAPGSADPVNMRYGDLSGADSTGSRSVLIYGDNRPGYRMQCQRWEYHSLRHTFSAPPMSVLRGLVALPLGLVELVVPALNGPRDLVTLFTHRPTGGGEKRVVRALEAERGAGFVISTGDVVTDGRHGRLWADFSNRIRTVRERAPYVAAPGNHERLFSPVSRDGWEATVQPALQPGRYWGAVVDPATDALWVFLDSDLLADPLGERDPVTRRAESAAQLAWADSVLARPARWRFVVLHHPIVSGGHYERDWITTGEHGGVENRSRLFEICVSRGVTAVIAGHEHLYQRVWVGAPGGRGFWHITTGGGGAPLYLVDKKVRESTWREKLPAGCVLDRTSGFGLSEYHYCRLEVPGRASGSNALRLTASKVSLSGHATVFDTLDLSKPPPGDVGSDTRSR